MNKKLIETEQCQAVKDWRHFDQMIRTRNNKAKDEKIETSVSRVTKEAKSALTKRIVE